MSRAPLIRQTKPEDLLCKVVSGAGRQFVIENNHSELQNWEREYVDFGGFFGTHGPYVFAAAPELRNALAGVVDMLTNRQDILRAIQPLMGPAEHGAMRQAALALAKANG